MQSMPPSVRRLIWSPLARKDLAALWLYFDEVASQTVANAIYSDIIRIANLLCDRPHIGCPRNDLKHGYRSARARPFVIYYRIDDGAIELLRVLHERRDARKALRDT